ncbi:hypothetical protein PA01_12845 [Azoarcus sp. PA01]|nr:hypothetical protein PA01_12845 [Azoarcus sp. PA01]
MPILSENIQFRASQVMDDVPEGGGRATAMIIRDGASNEIFPDISEADRAGGRVRLRKLFLSVDTPDTDQLLGANIVVAKPPADPNVSVSLFSTGDYFDRRADAANRVEAYLFAGPEWSGYLLENHIAGQRSIQIFQRPGTELPPIGRTLCLVQDEGQPAEKRQYIRIINVSSVEQTFSYSSGGTVVDYPALVVTAELSDALRQDLTGSPPNRLYTRATNGTKIRDTTVADAARYYGAAQLTAAANIGDLAATLDSVFTRLVPSAQTEVPLVDLPMAGDRIPMMPAAAAATSYSIAGAIAPSGRFVLRSGCFPGSLSLALGGTTLTDDGAGRVRLGSSEVGTINYATGEIALNATAPTASGTASVSYRPAAAAAQQAHTKHVAVTAENRSYVWVVPLAPLPAPGSVEFAYMAQGRWYALRDNGAGQLTGTASSYGSGTVSYVTGTLNLTTGALPDAGTAVLVSWASPAHYAIRAGATAAASSALRLDYTLAQAPVVPGTLAISYPVAGTTRTATDADQNGNITGTGITGTINYATGDVTLDFTAPPDAAANVANAYTWRDGADLLSGTTATISGGQFTVPGTAPFRNGGSMTFVLSGADVQLAAPAYITSGGQVRVYASSRLRYSKSSTSYAWVDQPVGTFDAATGVVTITGPIGATRSEYTSYYHWTVTTPSLTITGVADIAVERDTAAFDPQAVTAETIAPGTAGLTLDLTTTVADAVVAGSVVLSVAGSIYIDRAGTLYANPDSATGAAIAAGSIDYTTGRATLTYWTDNTPAAVSVLACLTRYGQWTAVAATFRAASAPLRPSSLYVAATSADGDALSATSDGDGVIAGTGIGGTVNYEYGIVTLEFTEPVDPGTIRYNAVAYSYLPLDATLLGLDPVRLPSDGRVPVFRPGEFAVFGRDIPLAPQTVTAAQVINLGVERLSRVRIVGLDGLGIGPGWSADLDAGTVTITDPTGWPQPVTITGRVEDMVRVSDVQISGDITFTRPLTHQFPVGSTVSSALMLGDQRARVSHFFDQQTWDGSWSDSLTGSAATASYNDAQYPPDVTNAGAITERWVIRWTNTTSIEVIGEHVGVIYTGPTSSDVAPLNPAAGAPYFRLDALGFGIGWSAGNVIRLNTVGAQPPIWAVLTVQQGATTVIDDAWEILARGDVDRI